MTPVSRRSVLKSAIQSMTTAASLPALAVAGSGVPRMLSSSSAISAVVTEDGMAGERPMQDAAVSVINPRARVPVSFIIDDSTCLVNLAHYAMPQFAETWPDRKDYQKPWWTWPREIPDAFVRKFGEWCAEREIKGKYSIVPQPACVGWVDRELPGWSHKQLESSLDLVRTLMLPNWDIHPEMATHTRVIDVRTGRPFPDRGENWMENWGWTTGKSVEQLTEYLAYSLNILKEAGLPCEGVTTPGGFAGRVVSELSQATLRSVREVFRAEIPHYFKFLYTGEQSVVPRVEYAAGLNSERPECVVSVIGCTGDWFGGWDGDEAGDPDRFITEDLQTGRMVEVIDRGEPAIMVCHWPGIYFNGTEHGFNVFRTVVERMHARYDHLLWMKLSEISRYWAAKELTAIHFQQEENITAGSTLQFRAPFSCPDFTVQWKRDAASTVGRLIVRTDDSNVELQPVSGLLNLRAGTYHQHGETVTACFNLFRGPSTLVCQT
ncbi:MAG: hypothetical protein KDA91_09900 [Planctomycetaceae bacterium]|nr:hypothetical protein [Planctomycetaceae bacterium]